jgi:hypothetical protein
VKVSPVADISPLKMRLQTDTNLHRGKSVRGLESTFVQCSSLASYAQRYL